MFNGLVLHSDQGWQYQHAFYQQSLKERGIIQSMSRKGNCYDNCIIETFFARMKNEMFYGLEKQYSTFKEFQTAVKDYIDYYNNKRIQEKTKMDVPCSIQGNIHAFSLIINVSRILGTYQVELALFHISFLFFSLYRSMLRSHVLKCKYLYIHFSLDGKHNDQQLIRPLHINRLVGLYVIP